MRRVKVEGAIYFDPYDFGRNLMTQKKEQDSGSLMDDRMWNCTMLKIDKFCDIIGHFGDTIAHFCDTIAHFCDIG